MANGTTSSGTPTPSDSRVKRALATLRPGEPPLDELTYEDQSWLANAFSALQKIYDKRETGRPGDDAFCIFEVGNVYVQLLAQWDAKQLVCEAASAKSVPEIAAILAKEADAALKKLGFEAPEVSPNYSQFIPIESVADLAYAARLLYRTLKHVYQIANITDVKHKINLPRPGHGEELQRWVEAGIIAREAQQAINAGYTLDTLQEAIKLGMLIDDSMSREAWQWQLLSTPTTVEYLQACIAARLNGLWVKAGLASRAPVEVLQTLQAMDVPPRYVPCAFQVRKGGTVVDCDAARRWYLAGVSPNAVLVFMKARVDVETAIAWLRSGFLLTEAIEQIQSGVSLESAKAQRAKVPFSKAFRGDTIRREFKDRVSEAVDVLDVPSFRRSSMFSSAETQVAFLDGGYLAHSGYGWGSHNWTIIVGHDALLLVCHRIGVQPPRRRRRDASPSRPAEDLEAMLQDQRLNRWNDLVAQARRPRFVVTPEVSG